MSENPSGLALQVGHLFRRPVKWEQLKEIAGHNFVAEIEAQEEKNK